MQPSYLISLQVHETTHSFLQSKQRNDRDLQIESERKKVEEKEEGERNKKQIPKLPKEEKSGLQGECQLSRNG